jgi:hypothetical protein
MKYDAAIGCEKRPRLFSLNVCIKNFMVDSYNDYLATPVYIILEMLLGEKPFANIIHFINISQFISKAAKTLKLVPLPNLPAYIAFIRKMSTEELFQ